MLSKPYKIIAGCQIFGNNHNVPIVYGFELSDKERKDFDYLDNVDDGTFFKYKNNVYDLGEFTRTAGSGLESIADGISHDTYFSGILVKFTDDSDFIRVYTYFAG